MVKLTQTNNIHLYSQSGDVYRRISFVSGQALASSDTSSMSQYTDCISVLLSQYYEFTLFTKNKFVLEQLKHCKVMQFTTACHH